MLIPYFISSLFAEVIVSRILLSLLEGGIRYASRLEELPWGQKMVRFYDPDGHLIEVRTPWEKQEGLL